jgi:hypothetical protein
MHAASGHGSTYLTEAYAGDVAIVVVSRVAAAIQGVGEATAAVTMTVRCAALTEPPRREPAEHL